MVSASLYGGASETPLSQGFEVSSLPGNPLVSLRIPSEVIVRTDNAALELRDIVVFDANGVDSFSIFGDQIVGAFDPALYDFVDYT